jgi:hypothetical protein
MGYWQQFSLDLISPVVGTALIGGFAAVITRRFQDRRMDRQFRMGLVSRLTDIAYTIHTELSFYERWVRHSKPTPEERDTRRQLVDEGFIAERIKLGALQVEIDAYFGKDNEPGARLHHLTDLIMLRYAIILELPETQLMEIVRHLGQPGHTQYSEEQLCRLLETQRPADTEIWEPTKQIETAFTAALGEALSALLATWPVSKAKGFSSTKMLTDKDQQAGAADLQAQAASPRPVPDQPANA